MRELGESDYFMNFYEIHETKNSVYMVLEFLPGGELLRQMSKKKKYGERVIRDLMRNLLLGLH